MSGQTTHSMSPMDCDRVAREDILENYLGDRLSPDDREAFEQHYFECARCFDDLRLLESIHTALRPAAQASALPTRQRLTWLATAAGLAAVIVLAQFWRPAFGSRRISSCTTRPGASRTLPGTIGSYAQGAPKQSATAHQSAVARRASCSFDRLPTRSWHSSRT